MLDAIRPTVTGRQPGLRLGVNRYRRICARCKTLRLSIFGCQTTDNTPPRTPAILAGLVDDVADHVDTLLRSVRESGY
jgi:hypothetical protein